MPFGSKEWANNLLRYGIKLCKKKYPYEILDDRIVEIQAYIDTLKELGFWWQAERLTNFLNLLKRNHKGIKPSKHTDIIKPKIIFVPKDTEDFFFWLYNLNINIRYVTKRTIYVSFSLKT